jgi:hypothetical protein
MNGLAKQIQPNAEFTLVHANARHSFLTVLSREQAHGALRVPFAASNNLFTPEKAKTIIPDLIYHLCNSAKFSKGLTKGELANALLVLGYSRNSAYYLMPLVDQGILKFELANPIRGDIELGRLHQPTRLYSIKDPNFQPLRNDYDLKDLLQKFIGRMLS